MQWSVTCCSSTLVLNVEVNLIFLILFYKVVNIDFQWHSTSDFLVKICDLSVNIWSTMLVVCSTSNFVITRSIIYSDLNVYSQKKKELFMCMFKLPIWKMQVIYSNGFSMGHMEWPPIFWALLSLDLIILQSRWSKVLKKLSWEYFTSHASRPYR